MFYLFFVVLGTNGLNSDDVLLKQQISSQSPSQYFFENNIKTWIVC